MKTIIKETVVNAADYIETLPAGTRISTLQVLESMFGEESQDLDSFNIHFEIFDEISRRGNIELDMSEHEGKLEGLPQYLAYVIRRK